MIQFHLPFAVFAIWMFLLVGAQQLPGSISPGPTATLLAAIGALATMLSPQLLRCRAVYSLAAVLLLLVAIKYMLGDPIAGRAWPLTLMECAVLAITVLLARWVASVFEELRTAIFCNLVADLKNRTQTFGSGQGELYREVRRARLFERPLAFLAVSAAPGTVEAAKDRFTEEVIKRMLRQYVTARIANLLSRRLKDCDVIAQRNSHFVAALPETDRDAALGVTRQLQAEARQELGIELRFGLSTCPDEEATFIGLLERAEEKMRRADDFAAAVNHDSNGMERHHTAPRASNRADQLTEVEPSLLAPTNIAR